MPVNISSNNVSVILEEQHEQSRLQLVQDFAEKVNRVLDEADHKIQSLIENIDQIIASQGNITMLEKSVDENKSNDSFWYERPVEVMARENTPQISPDKKAKKLTLSELSKKKQQLLHQLKDVDKELLDKKFQPSQSIKELKQLRSPKSRKQNTESVQQKHKLQKLNSIKNLGQNQGAHRTLELMQQLNRQKIKRHEDMIQRMQVRQQEQLKKIRQLEERRIKIELKKNLANTSCSQSKNAIHMNQKRALPALPKKVY